MTEMVAPYTGAWIETSVAQPFIRCTACRVAPYTGAWIETLKQSYLSQRVEVAPYTGAWIETENCWQEYQPYEGRTLHGCVD